MKLYANQSLKIGAQAQILTRGLPGLPGGTPGFVGATGQPASDCIGINCQAPIGGGSVPDWFSVPSGSTPFACTTPCGPTPTFTPTATMVVANGGPGGSGGMGATPAATGQPGQSGYEYLACPSNEYCTAGGGGGGGGGGSGSAGGAGAGGGIVIWCDSPGGLSLEHGASLDARGGGVAVAPQWTPGTTPTAAPTLANGGTVKIFYAGQPPDLSGIQAARTWVGFLSPPTTTATVTVTATATCTTTLTYTLSLTPTVTATVTTTATVTMTPTVPVTGLIDNDHFSFVPNPVAAQSATLSFALLDEADLKFELFDYAMVRVDSETRHLAGGYQQWLIDVRGLPNGVYFARLHARASDGRRSTATTKLAVVR